MHARMIHSAVEWINLVNATFHSLERHTGGCIEQNSIDSNSLFIQNIARYEIIVEKWKTWAEKKQTVIVEKSQCTGISRSNAMKYELENNLYFSNDEMTTIPFLILTCIHFFDFSFQPNKGIKMQNDQSRSTAFHERLIAFFRKRKVCHTALAIVFLSGIEFIHWSSSSLDSNFVQPKINGIFFCRY